MQVRNEEKARRMLGPDVDLVLSFRSRNVLAERALINAKPVSLAFVLKQIVGDVTKESTLALERFKGVKKVINVVSVIVGPKEGDTPDRAKYSQVRAENLRTCDFYLQSSFGRFLGVKPGECAGNQVLRARGEYRSHSIFQRS